MQVILKDIFLMDKGTSASTKFEWDEDIVGYRMDHPESMDWLIGHIHSHNTMTVFFSPTDWAELNDNCTNHNYYLSIIVNNYMDIVGKIAFTGDPSVFICQNEHGESYELVIEANCVNPFMFVYKCEFNMPRNNITVPREFQERTEVIEKKAAERWKTVQDAIQVEGVKKNNRIISYDDNKSSFPDWNGSKYKGAREVPEIIPDELDYVYGYGYADTHEDDTIFGAYLLRLGIIDSEDEGMSSIIEDLECMIINGELYAKAVVRYLPTLYLTFFKDKINKMISDKERADYFDKIMDGLINELKEEASKVNYFHELVDELIDGIIEVKARLRTESVIK